MNNYEKLLTELVTPMQTVEDTLRALFTERRVDTAVGAQLEVLGRIVGQPRNGADDDTYRRYIRARIAANKSNGLIEDVIKIARLVVNDPDLRAHVDNAGHASLIVNLDGVVVSGGVAEIVQGFLLSAVDGGVRVYTRYSLFLDDETFAFEGGDEGSGWGWSGDPQYGDFFSGATE